MAFRPGDLDTCLETDDRLTELITCLLHDRAGPREEGAGGRGDGDGWARLLLFMTGDWKGELEAGKGAGEQ